MPCKAGPTGLREGLGDICRGGGTLGTAIELDGPGDGFFSIKGKGDLSLACGGSGEEEPASIRISGTGGTGDGDARMGVVCSFCVSCVEGGVVCSSLCSTIGAGGLLGGAMSVDALLKAVGAETDLDRLGTGAAG